MSSGYCVKRWVMMVDEMMDALQVVSGREPIRISFPDSYLYDLSAEQLAHHAMMVRRLFEEAPALGLAVVEQRDHERCCTVYLIGLAKGFGGGDG